MLAERTVEQNLLLSRIEAPELYLHHFTKDQRIAILARDHKECQSPIKHDCGGKLNVHHIMLVSYALYLGIDPNFPENGITICRNFHDIIHPDIKEARKHWRPKSDVFIRVLQDRENKLKNHEVFWNATYDRILSAIAVRNTQQSQKKGWIFPR